MTGCVRCGTTIAPGVRFCPNCGLSVTGDVDASRTMVESSPSPDSGERARLVLPSPETVLPILRQATAGEFDVHGLVGAGGMSYVFIATEVALQRKVAIKVMVPGLVPDAGITERFKREARTAASLSHPAIIPIYAVRESEQLVYFVMKYIEGRTLETILAVQGPLPTPMCQSIIAQVAAGLAYAHRRGVVHRDIKPANILVDEHGFAVISDFGIAKVDDAKKLTSTGSILGTPHYMAPEQFAGQNVGPPSDQYALGVLAYECLVGAPPFNGATIAEVMKGHLFDAPVDVRQRRSDCPPALADVVMRMIAKGPSQRYPALEDVVKRVGGAPTGADTPVREALGALARASDPARRQSGPTSRPMTPSAPPATTPPPARIPTPLGLRIGGGVVLLMLAALAANQLLRRPTAPAAAPPEVVVAPASVPGVSNAAPPVTPTRDSLTAPRTSEAQRTVTPDAPASKARQPERREPTRAAVSSEQTRVSSTPSATPSAEAAPAPARASGTATIKLGSRVGGTVLYVNGAARRTVEGLVDVVVPAGTVRLSLKREGCAAPWDTTITAAAGETVRIGYRLSECQS
jgi:serine/threonine-protein kinase